MMLFGLFLSNVHPSNFNKIQVYMFKDLNLSNIKQDHVLHSKLTIFTRFTIFK